MTEGDRQQIARNLRRVDEARLAIENRNDVSNRAIIRDLRASADEIYDVINGLDTIEE